MQTTSFSRIAIIQSLPENDRHTGDELFEDINIVNLAHDLKLDLKLYNIKTKKDFISQLSNLANDARTADLIPILHIDMHGNEDGLEFASGDFITWAEIKEPLTELNIQTKNNLFMGLSSCYGAYLIKVLGLTVSERAPYCGLIGPTIAIQTRNLEGFSIFYRELLTTGDGDEAAKLLMESCPNSYYFTSIEIFFKKVFKKYLAESCTKPELKKRALIAYKNFKEVTKQNNIPYPIGRFKRELADTKRTFKKYKKSFFMIDLYPENKERFTLKYKDLKK